MQRLFIIALAFCVTLAAAVGVLLFVSVIPHFSLIGWAVTGLLLLGITCAASLLATFTFTRIGMFFSSLRRARLYERVIENDNLTAVMARDGTLAHHLSAMLEEAKAPRMLPEPKGEIVDPGLNEGEVIRTYQLGLSIKDTAKQHQGTEYEVRKILHKAGVVREK